MAPVQIDILITDFGDSDEGDYPPVVKVAMGKVGMGKNQDRERGIVFRLVFLMNLFGIGFVVIGVVTYGMNAVRYLLTLDHNLKGHLNEGTPFRTLEPQVMSAWFGLAWESLALALAAYNCLKAIRSVYGLSYVENHRLGYVMKAFIALFLGAVWHVILVTCSSVRFQLLPFVLSASCPPVKQ
ncbi:hypothetical protein Fcan01_21295 [Folsomia candida]|uniref:Uncharacterized protein n=1 Tax=Folsomia candida TaxID=158441 RepID=A0A226DFT2_FOLCA|nr:hypothetical protein Fcan01_21295 [Folsomia candida]